MLTHDSMAISHDYDNVGNYEQNHSTVTGKGEFWFHELTTFRRRIHEDLESRSGRSSCSELPTG
jgi:hypothetical protein